MRINTKNTAIGLLDHIDPFSFRICEDAEHSPYEYKQKLGLSVVSEFPKVAPLFKEKVQWISAPFHEAFIRAQHKLVNVIGKDSINESGTFITSSSPSETNTIFYSIETDGSDRDMRLKAIIFFFTKETSKDKPALAMVIQRNDKGFKSFFSETATKNGLDEWKVIADIYTLILFMKYCEVETKIIPPNRKDKHIGIKYLNETKNTIQILDSTWFTTIIKSEGFGVRGHFRMQPYGPSLTERKLIWIADFEKTGYTRTAKVLNENS